MPDKEGTRTSTCPYHNAVTGFYYNATGDGYGLAPMERWLNGAVGGGGSVVLQLGQQLGVECTCIELRDSIEADGECNQ